MIYKVLYMISSINSKKSNPQKTSQFPTLFPPVSKHLPHARARNQWPGPGDTKGHTWNHLVGETEASKDANPPKASIATLEPLDINFFFPKWWNRCFCHFFFWLPWPERFRRRGPIFVTLLGCWKRDPNSKAMLVTSNIWGIDFGHKESHVCFFNLWWAFWESPPVVCLEKKYTKKTIGENLGGHPRK